MKQEIIPPRYDMKVLIISRNVVLKEIYDYPEVGIDEHIGYMKEECFYAEQKKKIEDKNISQLMFIHPDFNTIFNYKQAKKLAQEIKILEEENSFDKEALEVLKKGVQMVLADKNKNLYLEIQYV